MLATTCVRTALLVAFALAAIPSAAQTRDVRTTTATGLIRGVVVSDDADAKPVRKVRVTCGAPDVPGHTTITDDQGRFVFGGLPPGRYAIAASKPTWVATRYGATGPMRQGAPVSLAGGQTLELVVRLAHGAVITGVLVDHNNQPTSATTVRALRYQIASGDRRLVSAGEATTDDRGTYRIFGLAAGDYYVTASARGLSGMTAGDIRLTSDADVRDAVSPRSNSAPPPTQMVALAPAYYPAGASVSQASPISLRPGEERTGVDFALQLVRTARVDGSVTLPDGGAPSGAEINLIAIGATAAPGLPFEGYRPGHPAADGAFSFSGVPPGQYTLLARASRPMATPDGSPAPAQLVWASTQIAVDGETITGLGLSLEPGLTIAGSVRFPPPSVPGLTAPDMKSIRISAVPADTQSTVAFAPAVVSASTDGQFTISGVMPGRYRLNATFPGANRPSGWKTESITANGQDALDFPLTVAPNQHVLDASVTLTDRLAQVSGVVSATSGTRADYTVVLFPEDQRMWLPQSRRLQGTRAAADGAYTFRNVPAGTYLVAVRDDVEMDEWFDPAFLQRLVQSARRITLQNTDTVVVDLRAGRAPDQ